MPSRLLYLTKTNLKTNNRYKERFELTKNKKQKKLEKLALILIQLKNKTKKLHFNLPDEAVLFIETAFKRFFLTYAFHTVIIKTTKTSTEINKLNILKQ